MKGRQRGRNGGKPRMHQGSGGGRNPNFDHNAGRMRGNAQQLMDKYLGLARDASAQGDRVLAENYFQHADHYYRVINARFEGQPNQQRRFNGQNDRGYESQDGQGNYQDYNAGSEMPPGPSQNLIPPAPVPDPNQPVVLQPAQPVYEPVYQPAPQQIAAEPDGDIGLPPQLFGAMPEADPAAHGGAQANRASAGQAGDDKAAGGRPRHAGRRRYGPRRAASASAAESAGDAS